jgi:hypothetical protein
MSIENNVDCPGAKEKDGDHKIYIKEPSPALGKPESYFLSIRVGSNKTIADYFNLSVVKWVQLGSSASDPDDPPTFNTWDWFEIYCPLGPPCRHLYEEFKEFRAWTL